MLDKIIEHQKIINLSNLEKYPEAYLQQHVKPTTKNMFQALSAKKPSYIFECKQKSPSQGVLNQNFDIVQLVKHYNPFASAISVLTNEPFFNGKLEDLKTIRNHTNLPLLCKDFILSPHQVLLARYFGADAVLLILSVLNDQDYLVCKEIANQLSMTILTEVHTEEELQRAIKLEAPLIGINQRNLKDLTIDKEVIYRLAPLIPRDRLVIAESGISAHQDIIQLKPLVQGFLIGTALNKTDRADLALRSLVYGSIKICGLTSRQSALCAYQAGATLGGLNFILRSQRYVSKTQAQDIIQAAPLQYVGVFADHDLETVVDTAKNLNLSAVQLHGHENDAYIKQLKPALPSYCKLFKAINGNKPLPSQKPDFIDKYIVDNQTASQLGGTNQCFNWDDLKHTALLDDVFIAGGINLDNVLRANNIGAYGLDINSGVESTPGVKDPMKIQELFNLLRSN